MNPEIIVNLWYILHKPTGVVYNLAGRTYYASGTDEEKLALLKQLASTDYLLATQFSVPDRFNVDGMNGCCLPEELDDPDTTLFEEVYQGLENEAGLRITVAEFENLKIPDNPLFVITALYQEDHGGVPVFGH